ncbi:MAG: plasmid replication protein RepC [Roseinatronobacter sp.]
MEYTPISPFKRPLSHVHLRVIERPEAPIAAKPVGKWDLLRELSKAQTVFGISERDLTVLQGLLSFFPDAALGGNTEMVVYPSNKAICERLNGMACSTMRRHLARLVEAGLITRRDSPNGKRYVRQHAGARVAFGFDLSPLWCRAEEISRAADEIRAREDRLRRLREVVSLMRRDLAGLAEFGAQIQPDRAIWSTVCAAAQKAACALRRKLAVDDLIGLHQELDGLLDKARLELEAGHSEEMSSNDAQDERHHQNSKTEITDLEPTLTQGTPAGVTQTSDEEISDDADVPDEPKSVPKLPLHLVIEACPALRTFCDHDIRHWHQLLDAACHIRPAMGISPSAWADAQRCMGPEQAAVVLIAMLERFDEIRSPGGYLRTLTSKAAAGAFSCGPMIMALLTRRAVA